MKKFDLMIERNFLLQVYFWAVALDNQRSAAQACS